MILEKVKHKFQYGKYKTKAKKADQATTIIAIKTRVNAIIKKNKFKGEISIDIKIQAIQFRKLFQGKIAKIFLNRFRPINLYKLCLIKK